MHRIDDSTSPAARRKAFFNRAAHNWIGRCYHDSSGDMAPAKAATIRALLHALPVTADDTILDVGCGSGVLAPYLLERLGAQGCLIELDAAEAMIDENRRLHADARIRFVAADLMTPGLSLPPIDAIVCFCCFPHFDDKPAALGVMRALLRPGGPLLIAHLMSSAELNAHHRDKDASVRDDHMLPAATLRTLLGDAGFTVLVAEERPGWYLALAERTVSATNPLR